MKKQTIYVMIAGIVIAIAALIAFAVNASAPDSSDLSNLTVTTLKIGKADAIVIQNNDKTMLIDAGEEEDGEEVADFLEENGVEKIDALVITHYDKDHVGGADTIVENFEIGDVYIPDYEGTRTEYVDFLKALDDKSITPSRLRENAEFSLGKADVLIETPLSYEIPYGFDEYDNNFSLITTVVYGENRFVFTGDAEKQRIREWLDNSEVKACDFLKIPHHGVYTNELDNMLRALMPDFAVITDSKKNPADDKTLELLQEFGVKTFEAKDGNITAVSDGKTVNVFQ